MNRLIFNDLKFVPKFISERESLEANSQKKSGVDPAILIFDF